MNNTDFDISSTSFRDDATNDARDILMAEQDSYLKKVSKMYLTGLWEASSKNKQLASLLYGVSIELCETICEMDLFDFIHFAEKTHITVGFTGSESKLIGLMKGDASSANLEDAGLEAMGSIIAGRKTGKTAIDRSPFSDNVMSHAELNLSDKD